MARERGARWRAVARAMGRAGRTLAVMALVAVLGAAIAMHVVQPAGAVADFNLGDTAAVDADRLNLRAGPGLSYDVFTVLTRGTQVTITDGPKPANDYTWFKIETADGATGWLIGEGLTQGGSDGGDFNAGDSIVVADGPLNLRASAGTDASVIVTLDEGTKLTVAGGPASANGFTWYQVKTADGTSGWVAGEFLAASSGGNGGDNGGDSGGADFSPYDRVQVATDALNLRAAPGTHADVIEVLTEGDRATVLDGPASANG